MFALFFLILASCTMYCRVVGGTAVSAGEHPHIAAILDYDIYHNEQLNCVGSILKKESPAVILTSALCVDLIGVSPETHFVRLYASDYKANHSLTNNFVDVSISVVVLHYDYSILDWVRGDYTYPQNDIALLFITEDISRINRLETVSVQALTAPPESGDYLQIVGYDGNNDTGSGLQETDIPYVSRSTCSELTDLYPQIMCAGAVPSSSSCDSTLFVGGPLLKAGTNQQIGITFQECYDAEFGIYTDVARNYDWLYRNTHDCLEPVRTPLVENIDVASDDLVYYTVVTKDDTVRLTITARTASGTADLFVRFGAEPTVSDYDCKYYANLIGTQTCRMDPAQAGTYHIMLIAYPRDVAGLSVHSIEWTPCHEDTSTTAEPTTTTSEPSSSTEILEDTDSATNASDDKDTDSADDTEGDSSSDTSEDTESDKKSEESEESDSDPSDENRDDSAGDAAIANHEADASDHSTIRHTEERKTNYEWWAIVAVAFVMISIIALCLYCYGEKNKKKYGGIEEEAEEEVETNYKNKQMEGITLLH